MTGEDIRKIRNLIGYNLEQLAFLCGISKSHLANIETGRKRLLPHMKRKISEALGVKPEMIELLVEFEKVRNESEK